MHVVYQGIRMSLIGYACCLSMDKDFVPHLVCMLSIKEYGCLLLGMHVVHQGVWMSHWDKIKYFINCVCMLSLIWYACCLSRDNGIPHWICILFPIGYACCPPLDMHVIPIIHACCPPLDMHVVPHYIYMLSPIGYACCHLMGTTHFIV